MTTIDYLIRFLQESERLYRTCACEIGASGDLHMDCVADNFRDWAQSVEDQRDMLAAALEELGR